MRELSRHVITISILIQSSTNPNQTLYSGLFSHYPSVSLAVASVLGGIGTVEARVINCNKHYHRREKKREGSERIGVYILLRNELVQWSFIYPLICYRTAGNDEKNMPHLNFVESFRFDQALVLVIV